MERPSLPLEWVLRCNFYHLIFIGMGFLFYESTDCATISPHILNQSRLLDNHKERVEISSSQTLEIIIENTN